MRLLFREGAVKCLTVGAWSRLSGQIIFRKTRPRRAAGCNLKKAAVEAEEKGEEKK